MNNYWRRPWCVAIEDDGRADPAAAPSLGSKKPQNSRRAIAQEFLPSVSASVQEDSWARANAVSQWVGTLTRRGWVQSRENDRPHHHLANRPARPPNRAALVV